LPAAPALFEAIIGGINWNRYSRCPVFIHGIIGRYEKMFWPQSRLSTGSSADKIENEYFRRRRVF